MPYKKILLPLLLLIVGCSNHQSNCPKLYTHIYTGADIVQAYNNSGKQGNTSIPYLLHRWKMDSLGCQGFRSFEIIQTINDSLTLEALTPSAVINLLGKPNESNVKHEYYLLRYYTNSLCIVDNGKEFLPDKTDKCWVEFYYADTLKHCLILPVCN